MTLRTAVFDRCTGHAGIAALIGVRCYPERLPENVDYPAISFLAPVSADNTIYRTHDELGSPTTRTISRVQINSYAESGDEAEALANQVYAAWDGYRDACNIGYAYQANGIMTREDAIEAWRVITDVIIEHSATI